jgi:hypothetical protein
MRWQEQNARDSSTLRFLFYHEACNGKSKDPGEYGFLQGLCLWYRKLQQTIIEVANLENLVADAHGVLRSDRFLHKVHSLMDLEGMNQAYNMFILPDLDRSPYMQYM